MIDRTGSVGPGRRGGQAARHWALSVAVLIIALLPLAGCAGPSRPRHDLRLAGAQIPVELVESWLKRADQARFRVERVTFTQSATGFEALLDGRCDLACTDRPPDPREMEAFTGRDLRRAALAYYAYALYVHPSNPVDQIFVRDVRKIFGREVTGWDALGGAPGAIHLYGPPKDSRGGLQLAQISGAFFGRGWTVCESDEELLAAVAADPLALAFGRAGLGGALRPLAIEMRKGDPPIPPTPVNLAGDRYPLTKMIYVYWLEPPAPAATAAVEFLMSPIGQAAIRDTDLVPLTAPPDAAAPARQ